MRAGAVPLPLELKIPAIGVNAPMLGVGLTLQQAMDSPFGPPNDPIWQKAFLYRGSGIPGDSGTATVSGHVDDVLGRRAVFGRLNELQPGALIVVHDTRSGLDIRFTTVKKVIYTTEQTTDPAVLAQVYGAGTAAGLGPQPAADGRSHLTLITCSGDFISGSYNRRLVVYADRVF